MPVDLSILIPVKDEVDSVFPLSEEIVAALAGLEIDWEVVFIDDGSTDATWERVAKIAERDPRFHGVRFRRNLGKSAALAAGLAVSRGSIIATIDGDLQDDPSEIPAMLSRLEGDETDVVAGFKENRKDPIGKRLPSKFFNAVTSMVTGLKLRDHNCGLKLGRREVFETAPLYGEMHRYFAAISHAQGYRVVEHPVNHRPRLHGKSKFGLERYARGALDLLTVVGFTRYNARPAHLFGGVGLVLGAVGVAVLLYLSGLWVFTDQSIGNRPLLIFGVLMVLVAVQLVSLGVLAEMIVNRDADRTDPLVGVSETTGP